MFKIRLADITFRINNIHDELFDFCHDYLTDDEYLYEIDINQKDIDIEREYSKRQDIKEGKAVRNYSDAYLETLALYRKLAYPLLDNNIIIFHGAVIAKDDKAYIFTAPSGTGKTTHINLWLKNIEDVYVLNGDKPLLKVVGDKIYACGTPWMGKEKMGINKTVQLKAICILSRDSDNHIDKISSNDSFSYLIRQIHIPDNKTIESLNILNTIINNIDLYHLYCNTDDASALISYGAMVNEQF